MSEERSFGNHVFLSLSLELSFIFQHRHAGIRTKWCHCLFIWQLNGKLNLS